METVPEPLRALLQRALWRRLRQRSEAIAREATAATSASASSLFSSQVPAVGGASAADEAAGGGGAFFYKFAHDGGAYACLLLSAGLEAAWVAHQSRARVCAKVEAELPQFSMTPERVCGLVSDVLRAPEEQKASVAVSPAPTGQTLRVCCPLALPGVAPVSIAWRMDLTDLAEYGDGTGTLAVLREQVVCPLAATAHAAAWAAGLLQRWAVAQAAELRVYRERFGELPGSGRGAEFDALRFRDDLLRAGELRAVMGGASIDLGEDSGWLSALHAAHLDQVLGPMGPPPGAGEAPLPPPAGSASPRGRPAATAGAARPAASAEEAAPSPKRRRDGDHGLSRAASYVETPAERARRELLSSQLAAATAAATAAPAPAALKKKIKKAFS